MYIMILPLLPLRSLPLRSLPLRSLPLRVLLLIREYSKPLTRPDWRTCKLISIEEYIYAIHYKVYINNNTPLFNLISNNIDETDFYKAYNHIYFFGIDSYILKYNLNKKDILSNKILNHQNYLYTERNF